MTALQEQVPRHHRVPADFNLILAYKSAREQGAWGERQIRCRIVHNALCQADGIGQVWPMIRQGSSQYGDGDTWRPHPVRVLLLAVFFIAAGGHHEKSRAAGSVYTIAKYPIEATADDAVAAKKLAMADGQAGAFRSLLKRLVPVSAYRYLPKTTLADIQNLTDGLNIRSEQNSSTEYLAELDFRYNAEAVRAYLQNLRLPYVERQAPETLIVPVYRNTNTASPRYLITATGQRSWRKAWSGLDLQNTLTPVKLAHYKPDIRDDVRQSLVDGDMTRLKIFQQEYSATRFMLAFAAPDASGNKLDFTFVGQDAIGEFNLVRSYPIDDGDLFYTAELAAVIGLGILEGRWKTATGPASGSRAASGGAVERLRFFVQFNGLGQWQAIRSRITSIPGVAGIDTGAVTARGAEIMLSYPGGMTALQQRISAEGMYFTRSNGQWLLLQN